MTEDEARRRRFARIAAAIVFGVPLALALGSCAGLMLQ